MSEVFTLIKKHHCSLMLTLLHITFIQRIVASFHKSNHHFDSIEDQCLTHKCSFLQFVCPHLFSSVTPQLITHWSQLCSSPPPTHYISITQEAGAFLKVVFPQKTENNWPCTDPHASTQWPYREMPVIFKYTVFACVEQAL